MLSSTLQVLAGAHSGEQEALEGSKRRSSILGDQVDGQVQPCRRLGTRMQAASLLGQGCLELVVVGFQAQGMLHDVLVMFLSQPHQVDEGEPWKDCLLLMGAHKSFLWCQVRAEFSRVYHWFTGSQLFRLLWMLCYPLGISGFLILLPQPPQFCMSY